MMNTVTAFCFILLVFLSGCSKQSVLKKPDSSSGITPFSRARLIQRSSFGEIPLSRKAEEKLAMLVSNATPMPNEVAKLIEPVAATPFFVLRSVDDPSVEYEWDGDRFFRFSDAKNYTNNLAGGLWDKLVVVCMKNFNDPEISDKLAKIIEEN
jgi:hypothetical protein